MLARVVALDDALQLIPIAAERAEEELSKPDARVWVDLHGPNPAELEAWLDRLEVAGLTRRLCVEARDHPGSYPLRQEMLLVLPVLADVDGQPGVDYVGFVCRETLLLTLHRLRVVTPERIAALDDAKAWLPERSIAGLVSALLVELSQDALRRTAGLRTRILGLEEQMDHDPGSVDAEAVRDLRAAFLPIQAAVSDQLPVLGALSTTDKPYFKLRDAQDYLNCALANLNAAHGELERLAEILGALRSALQMHAQDKTNRRLGALTALSAIFMPLSLLAALWGMNFKDMPLVSHPSGYAIALGLMTAIASGSFLTFRRFGWFD